MSISNSMRADGSREIVHGRLCVYIIYEFLSRVKTCTMQPAHLLPAPPYSQVVAASSSGVRAVVARGRLRPGWAAALVLASTTSMFCRTDSDCSLNGLCTAGICACDAPWAGNRCQTLQLAVGLLGLHDIPLCAYHGDGPNSTSWGALHARCMYTACMRTGIHAHHTRTLMFMCVQAVRCCMRRRTASTTCGQPR